MLLVQEKKRPRSCLWIPLAIVLVVALVIALWLVPPRLMTNRQFELWQVHGFWGFTREVMGTPTLDDLMDQAHNIVLAKVIRAQGGDTGHGDTEHARIFYTRYTLMLIDVYKGRLEIGDVIDLMQPYQIRHIGVLGERRNRRQNIRTAPLSVGDSYILFLNLAMIDRNILRTGQPYEEWREAWHVLSSSRFCAYRYTPQEQRPVDENWTFDSVDRQNHLVLTEQDLLRKSYEEKNVINSVCDTNVT